MSDTPQPVLRLRGITKRFGALTANDNISLDLHAGEVLALLGENGAGKSTLMSILFGHYQADAGDIEVFGQPLPPGNTQAALAAGIGMVHQHSTLADNLSVLDNIMLGTEPLWQPYTRRRAGRDRLLAVAQRFGLTVRPDARVAGLSVGERQRVEILKALYRGARILILDEPTAVLTPQESQALFATLAQMVAQGLAIIFISHKLAEVLRVSDRVAVLRAGRLVAQAAAADTQAADLAQWMVGQAVSGVQRHPAPSPGAVVAQLHGVCTHSSNGRDALHQVSLALHAGEIVAVAGVSGNGQVALAEVLSGTRAVQAGQAQLHGQPLRPDPAWLVAQGVARIPEDRHGVGVVGDLSLWENTVSERLGQACFSRWGWVRRRAAQAHASRVLADFDVRGAGPLAPARALSGGNMQKLIVGRALTALASAEPAPPPVAQPTSQPVPQAPSPPITQPTLIVAHQPTWGLDVGAVAAIQARLLAARDAGAAVLLISDDLDEVMTLGDRVAVLHAGRLTPARPAAHWSRDSIGLAMAGHVHATDEHRPGAEHALG